MKQFVYLSSDISEIIISSRTNKFTDDFQQHQMIFILFPINVCALWIIVPTLFIVLSVNLTKHVKHINKNLEFNFISFFTWKTVNANGERAELLR